ncbi:hypothetical protein BDV59DRAFT_183386 [Aspergillus ambiguus]|uniref:uncharacterized protein n=1 Tax=Aspergillus ambiguus TaxID=176160 RepID=UPI003CCD8062
MAVVSILAGDDHDDCIRLLQIGCCTFMIVHLCIVKYWASLDIIHKRSYKDRFWHLNLRQPNSGPSGCTTH